jgi:hypothetical protein
MSGTAGLCSPQLTVPNQWKKSVQDISGEVLCGKGGQSKTSITLAHNLTAARSLSVYAPRFDQEGQ